MVLTFRVWSDYEDAIEVDALNAKHAIDIYNVKLNRRRPSRWYVIAPRGARIDVFVPFGPTDVRHDGSFHSKCVTEREFENA